jgi:hypothetical protein
VSLLHPTTGDLWDRYLVLTMKIHYGKAAGLNVSHFKDEQAEVAVVLFDRKQSQTPAILGLSAELADVHDAIWPLTKTSPPELLRLNARRTEIREEIDKLTGEFRGPEKV